MISFFHPDSFYCSMPAKPESTSHKYFHRVRVSDPVGPIDCMHGTALSWCPAGVQHVRGPSGCVTQTSSSQLDPAASGGECHGAPCCVQGPCLNKSYALTTALLFVSISKWRIWRLRTATSCTRPSWRTWTFLRVSLILKMLKEEVSIVFSHKSNTIIFMFCKRCTANSVPSFVPRDCQF